MKKINLKGISEILSEKELKNVMGGSGTGTSKGCGVSCSGSCEAVGRLGSCSPMSFGCGCKTY